MGSRSQNTTFKSFKSRQLSNSSVECPRYTFIADHENDKEKDDPLKNNEEPHYDEGLSIEDIRVRESRDQPIIDTTVGCNLTTHALVIHEVLTAPQVSDSDL